MTDSEHNRNNRRTLALVGGALTFFIGLAVLTRAWGGALGVGALVVSQSDADAGQLSSGPVQLSGTVSTVDVPVPGVQVVAIDASGRKVSTSTDLTGRYAFELPAGEYTLKLLHSEYVSSHHRIAVHRSGEHQHDLWLVRGAEIRGTVVDHDGRHVAGAEVFVQGGLFDLMRAGTQPMSQTDDLGRFALDRVAPGVVSLCASRDGVARRCELLPVTRGAKLEEVRLVLPDGPQAWPDDYGTSAPASAKKARPAHGPTGERVFARLVDDLGRAFPGAVLELSQRPGLQESAPIHRTSRTDSYGYSVFDGVPFGTYNVRAFRGDLMLRWSAPEDLAEGTAPRTLVTSPGVHTFSVRACDGFVQGSIAGHPAGPVWVEARPRPKAAGLVPERVTAVDASTGAWVRHDKTFRIDGLCYEPHIVRAVSLETLAVASAYEVLSGERVHLKLRNLVSTTGTVVTEEGPVADYRFTMLSSAGDFLEAHSDPSGKFVVWGTEGERYRLVVESEGGAGDQELKIERGVEPTVKVSEWAGVTGRLVALGDTPIQNATLVLASPWPSVTLEGNRKVLVTTTDRSGSFSFARVSEGSWSLAAVRNASLLVLERKEFVEGRAALSIDLSPGTSADLGLLRVLGASNE